MNKKVIRYTFQDGTSEVIALDEVLLKALQGANKLLAIKRESGEAIKKAGKDGGRPPTVKPGDDDILQQFKTELGKNTSPADARKRIKKRLEGKYSVSPKTAEKWLISAGISNPRKATKK